MLIVGIWVSMQMLASSTNEDYDKDRATLSMGAELDEKRSGSE